MSIAAALILLVEATTTCGPAAPSRLGGGAQIAPAILEFDPEQSEPSMPALAGAGDEALAEAVDAESDAGQPEPDEVDVQCKVTPLTIA